MGGAWHPLSVPKIISSHSNDAGPTEWAKRPCPRVVGPLDQGKNPCPTISACASHCTSRQHNAHRTEEREVLYPGLHGGHRHAPESRAGVARAAKTAPTQSTRDAVIREHLLAHLAEQRWAPVGAIDVAVSDGVVTLSGTLTDDRQRAALCVAAANIRGVKKVEDRLAWVIPGSGMGDLPVVVGPPGD